MANWKKYECIVCGWVYDEEAGDQDEAIAPFTRWGDISEGFMCPLCAVGKGLFEEVRVSKCDGESHSEKRLQI